LNDVPDTSNSVWDFKKATPLEAREQQKVAEAAQKKYEQEAAKHNAELDKRATEILETGDPLLEIKQGYILNHFGDDEVYRAVVYASVLQSSITTKGLQIYINGEKGAGKSSSLKAAIHLLPPEWVVDSSFSSKALYYETLPEKSIIILDDSALNDEQVTLLKRCITNFQCETHHKTVINHQIKRMSIPARILWLGTSVMEEGDEQFRDRFVALSIRNERIDDEEYVKWELERRGQGRKEIETNHSVELSRAILRHFREREFIVEGIEKIKFSYVNDRRLVNMFLDFVEASAILHYKQRKHTISKTSPIITVEPNMNDIHNAQSFSFFRLLDPEAEGRLSRACIALDMVIQNDLPPAKHREYSEAEIAKLGNKTIQSVRKLLYGKDGNQKNITAGLCKHAKWWLPGQSMEPDRKNQYVITVHEHKTSITGDFAWFDNEPQ